MDKAMGIWMGSKCRICDHGYKDHRHFNTVWKVKSQTEIIIEPKMQKKFFDAQSDKEQKENLKKMLDAAYRVLEKSIHDNISELAELADRYAKLSLSGSFSSQVEKAIKLLEQQSKSMQEKGADNEMLRKIDESMDILKKKLDLLRKAQQQSGSWGLAKVKQAAVKGISKMWYSPQ
jgi:hypothetical protein